MRTIKFRAWHTVNKMMLKHKDTPVLLKNVKDDNVWKYMQFTGLLDKNGKEIFESDVVTTVDSYNGKVMKGVVIFQEFRASWAVKYGPHSNQDIFRYIQYGNKVEIIGNIYESPELLTRGDV